MSIRVLGALLLLCCSLAAPLSSQDRQPAIPTPAQIRAAAADVMNAARYCTLVTIGDNGQPQARIVDPLVNANSSSIWIATNPLSRKVGEIKRNARVTLLFFNATASEYVTVLGKATLVTDSAQKASHWKPEWAPFYKEQYRGPDFLLIEVRPFRLEVSSPRHGLRNDPQTWRPVVVDIP
jgi:general stress protein 26